MKVIFLSIGGFTSILAHDQYPDLLREFQKHGHEVYVVCSNEKRTGLPTELIEDNGAKILRVRIGNITQSGIIEKGIATLLVGIQYKKAIRQYFDHTRFDLVLYTTPPITLVNVVSFLKKKYHAKSYLILKDIFPQNAVDIGLMQTRGLRGLIYKYFRIQEKKLYRISDMIGTMSKVNTSYILEHNQGINREKVEECPNCLEIKPIYISEEEKKEFRAKYEIPQEKTVFVYGGNLGKPQDIPFVINCIEVCGSIDNAFFWIIGSGTEYSTIETYVCKARPSNLKLSKRLPKDDYDRLIASCDIGLIFLDHRFTIPNYPSRMLAYMQAGLPVLACTDVNTDIGKAIEDGGFGWWCESNDVNAFKRLINGIDHEEIIKKTRNISVCIAEYSSARVAEIILKSVC